MQKGRRRSIPKHFRTAEEAGRFWDTHDLGDYWEHAEPVRMSFNLQRRCHLFSIEPGLAREVRAVAAARGVSSETIANLWLREMLARQRPPRRRRASSRTAA